MLGKTVGLLIILFLIAVSLVVVALIQFDMANNKTLSKLREKQEASEDDEDDADDENEEASEDNEEQ